MLILYCCGEPSGFIIEIPQDTGEAVWTTQAPLLLTTQTAAAVRPADGVA